MIYSFLKFLVFIKLFITIFKIFVKITTLSYLLLKNNIFLLFLLILILSLCLFLDTKNKRKNKQYLNSRNQIHMYIYFFQNSGIITYALLVGKLPFTVEPFNVQKLCRKMVRGEMGSLPIGISVQCR